MQKNSLLYIQFSTVWSQVLLFHDTHIHMKIMITILYGFRYLMTRMYLCECRVSYLVTKKSFVNKTAHLFCEMSCSSFKLFSIWWQPSSWKQAHVLNIHVDILLFREITNDFFALDYSLLHIRMITRKKSVDNGHFNPGFDNRINSFWYKGKDCLVLFLKTKLCISC